MSRTETVSPPVANALREIAEGTSAETGERFFDALVQYLAGATATKCAWVTEWHPDKRELHALSFWDGTRLIKDYRYAVAHSPCETVVEEKRLVHIPDRLIELYPKDDTLKTLGGVSYMGVPLLDTNGSVLGHLAALDDKPMDENDAAVSILHIFAGRAAAELRRLRRERALSERERKLARLFEGAMDAIIEFDADLRVTNFNPAAAKTFGKTASEAHGMQIGKFVSVNPPERLSGIIDDLDRKSEGERSLWILDKIEGISRTGNHFPAEATISRYETEGQTFYALVLRNILERIEAEERLRSLANETEYLRTEIEAIYGFDEIIGGSPALRSVLADVAKVADSDATVLITGETGTGKELIARAIHRRSGRADKPLITVNCAAISANLQESEFFGHEKGSFTGAVQRRDGRFKLANGGTIFLDEVGEMSLDLQAKLLRVLQDGEFEPVGSSHTLKVDVRIIAATNRDLLKMSDNGQFRSDLLYRLNVFPLHLPPLRERRDDVLILADMFARKLATKRRQHVLPITESMKQRLLKYEWPGNVRELQNVIERALITSVDGKTLNLDRALPELSPAPAGMPESVHGRGNERIMTSHDLKELERLNIVNALRLSAGRISGTGGAAALLGIPANTLASRMKSLKISKD